MEKCRVAVLISGRGSNLKALAQACLDKDFPAEVVVVISNRADAPGLEYAQKMGIPTHVVERKKFTSKIEFEDALDKELRAHGVEIICAAGFMLILSEHFIQKWPFKILNIHPSLLPLFPGLDTHARALQAGVSVHGATVHYMTEQVDGGPIVAQMSTPVFPTDTVDTLAARVLEMEHVLYPQALSQVCSNLRRGS